MPPPEAGRWHDVRCIHCHQLLFRTLSLKFVRGIQIRCRRCKQTLTASG
jgi:phage FluMu protein Com